MYLLISRDLIRRYGPLFSVAVGFALGDRLRAALLADYPSLA